MHICDTRDKEPLQNNMGQNYRTPKRAEEPSFTSYKVQTVRTTQDEQQRR